MEVMFFKSKDCPQCPRAQDALQKALEGLAADIDVTYVDISTVDGRIEALNNMVMETPSLKVGDEVYGKADILDAQRVRQLLLGE